MDGFPSDIANPQKPHRSSQIQSFLTILRTNLIPIARAIPLTSLLTKATLTILMIEIFMHTIPVSLKTQWALQWENWMNYKVSGVQYESLWLI